MAQTAARHMWKAGSGVILQTASTNGIVGQPYYADYNATKAGVIELTKTMALELAPKVRVCAIAPGYVLTPMQRAEYTDAMLEAVNEKVPLKRHAQPEEIAALFAFLASDDAAYVTGQVFTIDGKDLGGLVMSIEAGKMLLHDPDAKMDVHFVRVKTPEEKKEKMEESRLRTRRLPLQR